MEEHHLVVNSKSGDCFFFVPNELHVNHSFFLNRFRSIIEGQLYLSIQYLQIAEQNIVSCSHQMLFVLLIQEYYTCFGTIVYNLHNNYMHMTC